MFALKHKIMNSSGSNNGGGSGGGVGGGSRSSFKNERKTSKDDQQLFSRSQIVPKDKVASAKKETALEISDIIDDDDLEDESSHYSSTSIRSSVSTLSSQKLLSTTSKPIDMDTAKKLKVLLIGDASKAIGPEWSLQYFDFETRVPDLWYGLVQHQGGPCGLMATVQGYLCAEFFHLNDENVAGKESDLDAYRYSCLARAIANLLWQIGGHKQKVIVAFESNRVLPGRMQLSEAADFVPDGITEHIRVSTELSSSTQVSQFLGELFSHDRQCIGAISLAYSCILTRGLNQIKQDYDSGSIETLLTPERLLCTQELVNLTLIGRAVSNVFDRNFAISSEMILQGINRQSLIGFLTIHEHEGAFKVGNCYKNSKLPIYLVLNEYHFTLLFSKQKFGEDDLCSDTLKSNKAIETNKFDLFYYDGLLGQDHEIRLTIDANPKEERDVSFLNETNEGICPIEFVIRTKWPAATVDWNGSSKMF